MMTTTHTATNPPPIVHIYRAAAIEERLQRMEPVERNRELFGTFPLRADWLLLRELRGVVLRLKTPTRVVGVLSRRDGENGFNVAELSKRRASQVEIADPDERSVPATISFGSIPVTLDGVAVTEVAVYELAKLRGVDRHAALAPARPMRLDLSREHLEMVARPFIDPDSITSARILLAATTVGTNTATLADFLDLPENEVEIVATRLRTSGVFRGDQVLGNWHIVYTSPLQMLMLDVMVGVGELCRDGGLDGPPRYRINRDPDARARAAAKYAALERKWRDDDAHRA